MHNTLTRAQNVFGFFTSVAAALACAIALLSLASAPTATSLTPGSLTLRNVQVYVFFFSPLKSPHFRLSCSTLTRRLAFRKRTKLTRRAHHPQRQGPRALRLAAA